MYRKIQGKWARGFKKFIIFTYLLTLIIVLIKEYEETNTVWFNPSSFETDTYFKVCNSLVSYYK